MPEKPVWGIPAIAKAIGRCERSVQTLLANDALPGGMLVGGKYCFFPSQFFEAAAKRGKAKAAA